MSNAIRLRIAQEVLQRLGRSHGANLQDLQIMARTSIFVVLLTLSACGAPQDSFLAEGGEGNLDVKEALLSFRSQLYPDAQTLDSIVEMPASSQPIAKARERIKVGDLHGASEILLGDPGLQLSQEREYWFTLAYVYRTLGEPEKARDCLHQILRLPINESQTILRTWYLLRQLGEEPPKEIGLKVLGVVVELAFEDLTIVVGGYEDGTPWMFASTDAYVIGEAESSEEPAQVAARRLVREAESVIDVLPRETDRSLPQPGWIRVAVLTPSGVYAGLVEEEEIGESKLKYVGGAAQDVETALVPLITPDDSEDYTFCGRLGIETGMNVFILLAFVASEIALSAAAAHFGLRAVRFAIVGGIGYITAWIFGVLFVSEFAGEKAPLGLALGWIGVCFAATAFLKSRPAQPEEPAGTLAAVWALSWRGIFAVMLACVCGVRADFFAFYLAGLLGVPFESILLYLIVVGVYIVTCFALSFLLFLVATKRGLGAVHSAVVPILRRES
ncbi:MAG: tetratricopeptide repeat protein [bacterium]|nr:tetratricopeptide repeat protein [bacterium]